MARVRSRQSIAGARFGVPITADRPRRSTLRRLLFQTLAVTIGIAALGCQQIVGLTWEANTGLQQPNATMRPVLTWLMSFLGR